MRNAVLNAVRDAITRQPVKFTTLDLYAVLPKTPKTSVTSALSILVGKGELCSEGKVNVQWTVGGDNACGRKRSMDVRAFSRPEEYAPAQPFDAYVPIPRHDVMPWSIGSKRLESALEAWPASPAVSVYE